MRFHPDDIANARSDQVHARVVRRDHLRSTAQQFVANQMNTKNTDENASSSSTHSVADEDSAWLSRWANRETARRREGAKRWETIVTPRGGAALYLYGSLGFDACVGLDGSFWVREYDFDSNPDTLVWIEADLRRHHDVVAYVACNLYPEFHFFLPTPDEGTQVCFLCRAERTGGRVCPVCHGLGWVPSL